MEDRIESLVLVTTKSVRNLFAISSLESKFAHVCWFKDSTTKTQRKPQPPRWQERGGGVITFVFRTQGILKSIGSIIVLRHAAPGSRVLDMVLWSGASYRRFCVCVCVCGSRTWMQPSGVLFCGGWLEGAIACSARVCKQSRWFIVDVQTMMFYRSRHFGSQNSSQSRKSLVLRTYVPPVDAYISCLGSSGVVQVAPYALC